MVVQKTWSSSMDLTRIKEGKDHFTSPFTIRFDGSLLHVFPLACPLLVGFEQLEFQISNWEFQLICVLKNKFPKISKNKTWKKCITFKYVNRFESRLQLRTQNRRWERIVRCLFVCNRYNCSLSRLIARSCVFQLLCVVCIPQCRRHETEMKSGMTTVITERHCYQQSIVIDQKKRNLDLRVLFQQLYPLLL